MKLLFSESTPADFIQRKAQELGAHCEYFTHGKVRDLEQDSSDEVYLAPYAITRGREWARLRVALSQANRFYIVFGEGLASEQIVEATREGAYDVLLHADSPERWQKACEKAAASQRLWIDLYHGQGRNPSESLIGISPIMSNLRGQIKRLGPTGANVLIRGESGSGKERVAHALHKATDTGPFVAVNCSAIPKDLLEAELFGAEKGAYTGSVKSRQGLVQQAAGGTLFLDEIGDMDISVQPKLLRFLETRTARKVGSETEYKAEARIISATNTDLERAMHKNLFRPDLFYRLSEITLFMPPLREHLEDVPLLAQSFMEAAGERFGKFFDRIEPELITKFQRHVWPGNVRELKSAIDRLVIFFDGPVMRAGWWDPPVDEDLQQKFETLLVESEAISSEVGSEISSSPTAPHIRAPKATVPPPVAAPLPRKRKWEMAAELLEQSGNDLAWVAAQLGIHPTTLYRWRKSGKIPQ